MPLKSVRVTVNVPGALADLAKRRSLEERYPSLSAYFVGLLVFDLYARKKHQMTADLLRDPQALQDAVFDEIARDFDNLATKPGSWFKRRIEELAAELVESHNDSHAPAAVAAEGKPVPEIPPKASKPRKPRAS